MLGRTNEANPEKEAFLAHLNRIAVNVDAWPKEPEFKKSGFASSKKNASIYALLINIIVIAQLERVITKSDIRIEKLMEIVYSKLNVLTQQSDFFTHDCEAAYYVLFVNMTLVSPKIK